MALLATVVAVTLNFSVANSIFLFPEALPAYCPLVPLLMTLVAIDVIPFLL